LTHKTSPLPGGGSTIADPDAGTVVININAPVWSERELQDLVVGAMGKARGRGGQTGVF
jgi:hypothetical protein